MLDLSNIIMFAVLCLGAVVGEATLFGDPMQVRISVPPKLVQAGFTEAAAEQLFAARVGDMGQAVSMVPTPSVQMSVRPTVLAALAKPLNLDNLVVALQGQIGIDVVTVDGVLLTADTGKQLDLVMVVSIPHEIPSALQLTQADGNATALVQQGADAAMERVSPYRLALTYFTRGLHGDKAMLTHAKDIATSAIARPWEPARATERVSQPWDTVRATELVMLHNMLAMLALLDGDMAVVEAQLQKAGSTADASPSAYGAIAFSQTFLDVAAQHPVEAERHYELGKSKTAAVRLEGWASNIDTLGAQVAWSRGDLAKTEQLLRDAIAASQDAAPHVYLAQLLEAKGDSAGAAAERRTAENLHPFGVEIPDQPLALFWVDPVHGGTRRRS